MPHPPPISLPITLPPETYNKFSACVHCGMCLPACPTYLLTGDEADSPRGRILLMKAVVDQRIQPTPIVFEHLDRCLVCRACEPACPSSVEYHDLLEATRPQIAAAALGGDRRIKSRLLQWIILHIFPYPRRVTAAILPLRLARSLGFSGLTHRIARHLPAPLADMTAMLPDAPLFARPLPLFTPASGDRQGSVLLLRGCVGNVLSRNLNRDCLTVLSRNGFDVHLLDAEPCCGAMAEHANDPQSAADFARRLVEILAPRREDYFVSPIAGCGSQLKALPHILRHTPAYCDPAAAVTAKIRDITELLAAKPLRLPLAPIARTVAYHDPCHLLNAQKLADPPRTLLAQIPGLTVVPLHESDLCCGAAGTYNLSQPALSASLGDRKAAHILNTGAEELLTANIGCQLQIQRSLHRANHPLPVRHVIELLAEAYREEPQPH